MNARVNGRSGLSVLTAAEYHRDDQRRTRGAVFGFDTCFLGRAQALLTDGWVAVADTRTRIVGFLNPGAVLKHYWQYRELIVQLTNRNVSQRYRGAFFGIGWQFAQPLLLLCVYTFIFGVVFKSRWPGIDVESTGNYAMLLFCGIVTFQLFGETLNGSPRLIRSHLTYVKKVAFPLEVLPLVLVLTSVVNGLFSLLILLVGLCIVGTPPTWSALLLPIVWIPLALMALGLSYFISSLSVFIPDLEQVVGLAVTTLFFSSGIFFPLSAVPDVARDLIAWLPTAVFIDDSRHLLIYGSVDVGWHLAVISIVSALLALAGFIWFVKSKRGFADVI